ncbi:MAG TPA: HlyD family type I secretion periplasmic adaptor subunit [Hyphomonas sp.]|nr:HlyD family type I secretion periplasmic adaptor subunit [Hyphomonas sp.]MCB9962661.1 HlyD family type I secretion periplasmic adaptor subunit [Hyphomonas sp.]MCB9970060.1 HlyD family type I secretion periplasmic adaptor subunit [Hyphomonas sp.]MCC0050361.1 HlyD family type I secretion periplasmic adaptor subunit [Rhodobiaceae bacterium]HPE48588.1 HlyD family type I secretion periplasmic adaptor subunit [Hyphomonas sp.]
MAEQAFSFAPPPSVRPAEARLPQTVRLGWSIILLVFGGLVAWSVLAPFHGAILTAGHVTVENEQQIVQHLEGGIVRQLYVREGDQVSAGQKLLSLDPTTADATIQAQEARLFDLLGNEARLTAERDGRETLVLRPGFDDIADSPRMKGVLDSQKSLLKARNETRATQRRILEQRISQLRTRIEGMQKEISTTDTQISLLEDEVARFQKLSEQGNASEVRVLSLKRDLSRLQGEKESLRSDIAATRVQIGEAQSEIVRVEQDNRETVLTELRDVQTQIGQLTEERSAALDRRNRLDILAPSGGRVIGVRTHTVGGVVTPSEPIMYIVPENDRLVAKVRVRPADIDKISIGQRATLRFTAFDQNMTPQYTGEVINVSADALQDPTTGATYYEAVVSIPDEALNSETFTILPGMPVDASLQTESRTVLSYLLKPLMDSVSRTFRE